MTTALTLLRAAPKEGLRLASARAEGEDEEISMSEAKSVNANAAATSAPVAKPASATSASASPAGAKGGKSAKARKPAKVDDFVLGLHRVSTMLADADVFSKHGVTVGEWATLKAMGDKPEVSLREVTKGAGVSRQRMRTLLTDLEKKGFIKTGRSGDSDKRTRAITVLPKRTEVVNAISTELDGIAAKVPQLKSSSKRLVGVLRVVAKLGKQLRQSKPAAPKGKTPGGAASGKASRAEARAKKRAERSAKQAKSAA